MDQELRKQYRLTSAPLHTSHAVLHIHSIVFIRCSPTFKMQRNTERQYNSGVGNLWLASQMWLFRWRHLARWIFS